MLPSLTGRRRSARPFTHLLITGWFATLVLLSTGAAEAQTVVYSGIQNIMGSSPAPPTLWNSTFLDLDGNGSLDFDMRAYSPTDTPRGPLVYFTSLYAGAGVVTQDVIFVKPLEAGAFVGPGVPGGDPIDNPADRVLLAQPPFPSGTGPWPQSTTRFLGVQFLIGANTHYGWIRTTPSVFDDHAEFVIHDWAYNSTPNEAIVTGDTGAASAVPEPGALALFVPGLGVVAVLRRRQRARP